MTSASSLAPLKALLAMLLFLPSLVSSQSSTPDVSPEPGAGGALEQPVKLGFDDLMTLLIQPRHLKLFYAGQRNNWELAAAEMRDLRAGLGSISTAYPKYLKNDVKDAIASLIAPPLLALDEAIAKADSKQFAAHYNELTAACNACHIYMEHPYVVITGPKSPAATAYPDQEFRPLRD